MIHFIVNTKALAQSKEGGLVPYPEREKDPRFFYEAGSEVKPETVYVSVFTETNWMKASFYGMQTPFNFRGLYVTAKISHGETQHMRIETNLGTNLSAGLLQKLWSGGPYSFLVALAALEEEILKENTEHKPWLRQYLLKGGIGAFPEKRMKYSDFFKQFGKIFNQQV